MHEEVAALFDISGKVGVVTGGAVHLGFDAASILAAAGCRVALTSRDRLRASASARQLVDRYGVEVLPVQLDQTASANVAHAAATVLDWQGHIDILVNNAAGGSGRTPGDLFVREPADIARLLELNLTGVLYCCREFGRAMAGQRSGKIINIASVAGIVGRDRRLYARSGMNSQPVEYAVAKAGIIGMTRDLAAFFGPLGVHVNAISPGGFARDLPQRFVSDYSDRTPLGRMGRDGFDLKGAILFLASPASDYVTGHNLVVDGGFSIWQ